MTREETPALHESLTHEVVATPRAKFRGWLVGLIVLVICAVVAGAALIYIQVTRPKHEQLRKHMSMEEVRAIMDEPDTEATDGVFISWTYAASEEEKRPYLVLVFDDGKLVYATGGAWGLPKEGKAK